MTKNGSSMTLRFSHPPSYPKAALREDLKYKILWKNDPERDNSYPSTSGTSGSVTVSGDQGSSPSFTLRVSYKSRPGLGYIFSEKCEGTHIRTCGNFKGGNILFFTHVFLTPYLYLSDSHIPPTLESYPLTDI